jgi:hypothetical protein
MRLSEHHLRSSPERSTSYRLFEPLFDFQSIWWPSCRRGRFDLLGRFFSEQELKHE